MSDICVPFRGDGAERDRNWTFLKTRWSNLGWPLYVSDSLTKDFSAAQARNRAVAKGTSEVILCVDADVYMDYEVAIEATSEAWRSGRYVAAYDRICYLDEEATLEVIQGRVPQASMTTDQARLSWPTAYALPRSLWKEAGGQDERFHGWGFQDLAFFHCCMTLAGATRVEGTIFHLDHPRRFVDNRSNPHYSDNADLYFRYRAAETDRDAMLRLVAEHR